MAILQVLKGTNPGQQFPLDGDKFILGRSPDCDIVLDAGAVSRQHAEILRVNGEYFIQDLGSRNGTNVNGQQTEGRFALSDNDRIKICDLLFTFHKAAVNRKSSQGQVTIPDDARTMIVDDEGAPPTGSTIMSTLDVKSSRSGLRMSVNPEVKLKALVEMTKNLGAAISLEVVLKKILDSLFVIFAQADRGFVVLQEREGAPLIPKTSKHRRADTEEATRISRTICNQVMSNGQAILSADAASDSRFDSSQSIADVRIRSMMCAPLINSDGRALGVIQIDTLDQRSRFNQDDLDVLASVANLAALFVENAQLHEAAVEKLAMERDLSIAHEVQMSFLPDEPPKVPQYAFFDYYLAAKQVGGDYYDYIPLPGNRLGIVLADVAGKGIPAALLMSKLSAEARISLVSERSPAQAIVRLNNSFGRILDDRFVTLVLCVLDMNQHTVTLVNAGHMPPYLRTRDGQVIPMGDDQAGVVLGAVSGFEYEEYTFPLQPGECLTMFTDGISEAMNEAGELYGLDRLRGQLQSSLQNVPELGDAILDDVKDFVGRRAQADDMCLICLGRDRA